MVSVKCGLWPVYSFFFFFFGGKPVYLVWKTWRVWISLCMYVLSEFIRWILHLIYYHKKCLWKIYYCFSKKKKKSITINSLIESIPLGAQDILLFFMGIFHFYSLKQKLHHWDINSSSIQVTPKIFFDNTFWLVNNRIFYLLLLCFFNLRNW